MNSFTKKHKKSIVFCTVVRIFSLFVYKNGMLLSRFALNQSTAITKRQKINASVETPFLFPLLLMEYNQYNKRVPWT